jgi:hypothetical protein
MDSFPKNKTNFNESFNFVRISSLMINSRSRISRNNLVCLLLELHNTVMLLQKTVFNLKNLTCVQRVEGYLTHTLQYILQTHFLYSTSIM